MNISPRVKFERRSIGGMPVLEIIIDEASRKLIDRFGSGDVVAVRADGDGQRLRIMPALTADGKGASFDIIRQDAADLDFIERMGEAKLVAERLPDRLRITPDVKALLDPPALSPYAGKTLDDLLTLAAQRNLPVPRDILRQDLERILSAEPDQAATMAKNARPAQRGRRKDAHRHESQSNGAMYSATTFNADVS